MKELIIAMTPAIKFVFERIWIMLNYSLFPNIFINSTFKAIILVILLRPTKFKKLKISEVELYLVSIGVIFFMILDFF